MATTIQDGSPSTHTTNGPTSRKAQMRVEIPKNREPSETDAIRTPKTPQNEGISWFESSHVGSQPVQVYELKLESDGGPNKNRAYTRLPPPASPYILRLSLDAGTPASKRGVLKTNFPLYGGAFERTKFVEKTLPSDFSKPVQIDLPISSAGVFVYWIEYDGKDGERSQDDVDLLVSSLREYLNTRNLWQYYVLDVTGEKKAIGEALTSGKIPSWDGPDLCGKSDVEVAKLFRSEQKIDNLGALSSRFCASVKPGVAAAAMKSRHPDSSTDALVESWGKILDIINVPLYEEWKEDTEVAFKNIVSRIKYTRLEENGPKLGPISSQSPLLEKYFTRIPQGEKTAKHDPRALSVANNGWIWGADPLANFAAHPSKAYLRREVIVWEDCVKLNYGNGPEDNPWLWKHMTEYVTLLAGMFDGFRIDNCHSTPLHVGCALLDAARVVNPDLYICAELFTGSEETDITFVSRLGITSLIREGYNAWDPKEMSRILYRFGVQKPIGSMDGACMTSPADIPPPTGKGPIRAGLVSPLQGSVPHAVFFDLTHDNESPLHKRSAEDALSTGALVAFSHCAVGSVKGFDDLYPRLLSLGSETRRYDVSENSGIGQVKRILNNLHTEMALEGFGEAHVHQENDYIVIHRVEPKSQRDGTWAMDYIHQRLEKQVGDLPNLAAPAKWLKERFDLIKQHTPSFLRPKYFAIVVSEAYKAARRAAIEQSSDFVASGHSFIHDLALSSVQMYGLVKSASLDPGKVVPSLAAGLPHFTGGWARTWGRDVFISLRGLFLTTGNYPAAKQHILAFSSTLKHGLIPNLLDSVRSPRYNSRDSPWWMLQNIQDYTLMAPDGLSILGESVKRRFPKDDTWVPWDDPVAYSYSSTVAEVIQEILQRHASGISFREYNAGPNLDMQMTDQGFQIDIHVDWKTGMIHGGSAHNCGTWMDKMGESVKAGTKGKPGTPRDGAPVEITGLLKSTLRWLAQLSHAGKFPFEGVEATIDGKTKLVTYQEWSDLIQASFEFNYYVPADPAEDASYNVNPAVVNRRGIYKDTYGAGPGREWSDYQFRCNFPIAMAVAPELFDAKHALGALSLADIHLRGPLGMKTLDAADLQYRGNYDNSNDSDDPHIAKGLNYHQGPEWGWPLGYFLRAYLHFEKGSGASLEDVLHHLFNNLLPARRYIQEDPWAGIPELTNENGSYCHDSCRTQAWSNSTLLDFLHDVYDLRATA
ncbi:hypothetical protein FRC18_007134 [Serendipita sp. 400]|nr:hypothetical protein FRC18_007134 [Serendipita sp. 400]